MTTSTRMPDVKVEIAFNAGYITPAASRTWTDVSQYVELRDLVKIVYGRTDESTRADANRLDLTLDNTDGRFTAGKVGSPYYPNVKIGRPIKVTVTPVGGAPSIRFLGYVDEWPTAWAQGTDAYAKADIAASSRIARLGFDTELQGALDEQVLLGDPDAYYPMNEPDTATAAADSTSQSPPLMPLGIGAAPTFGAPAGLQDPDRTGVQFTSGKYLRTLIGPTLSTAGAGVLVEAFTIVQLNNVGIFELTENTYSNYYEVGNDVSIQHVGDGRVEALFGGSDYGLTVMSPAYAAGTRLHVAARLYVSGANQVGELFINGVSVGTDTTPHTVDAAPQYLWAGHAPFGTGTSVVSNIVINAALADLPARASVGVAGFDGDTASARIIRYATFAGIDPAEVNADAGTAPVSPIETQGRTAIDAMRAVEITEGGVLHDARDNTLRFRGRAARYNTTTALTVSATLGEIEAGLEPKLDRAALVNDVTATANDGTSVRVVNQPSADEYGHARDNLDIASNIEAATQAANWAVNTHGEPQSRIPAFGVNLMPLNLAGQTNLLAADIGTRLTAAGLPVQAPAGSLDYFVEGYAETIGEESYMFDFNVSPTTGYDVWTCQDATFGAFDEYPIAL